MKGQVIHIQTIGFRGARLPEERCPVSHKRRFLTQSEAEQMASEWAHHNSSEYDHAYFCKHCKGWHLTKKAKKGSLSGGDAI